jgi:drug/metabolite transporter (DMT)-like permease
VHYGFAFWLYLIALRRSSAPPAGSFITLVPVFGVVAGYLAGERLTPAQCVGTGVVVGTSVTTWAAIRQHRQRLT